MDSIENITERLQGIISDMDDHVSLSKERDKLVSIKRSIEAYDISDLPPLNSDERTLVANSDSMAAIRSYCERTGTTLKKAKYVHDAYRKNTKDWMDSASKGETCPECAAHSSWVKCVGSNPDGIRTNRAYDCLFCDEKWEGY